MVIRRAEDKDIDRILELLLQVCNVHADIRPDLFIHDGTKYSREDLHEIIIDDDRPIFVAVEDDNVLGYCFCQYKGPATSKCIKPFSQLFIDDLCVDESARGKRVGRQLFEYVKEEARRLGCYEVSLNVWEGNDAARKFYEKMGMKTKETQMEIIL
ncbi:MAG: GNAT family N-acetyltransferase [Butyrivibrio sp.]|nr:GNAT family N-acetyltransferase [Butyrivibrio sp.]